MEWKISNAASVSIFGSGVSIDELRLYPAEAQMSSFTYLPAIGITSKCDINNRISYYLYDGSGRLQYVLDEHRNILKKIGYNYAGQPENSSPGTVFWNNFYTTTIQRSDCGSGYAGETVTYTVPAHTLSSTVSQLDADKKTLADAATNGQAYANTHGSCQLVAPQVTSINYVGVSGFKVVYTNTSTNQQYSFPISDTSGTKILGTVPAGVYNVVISKTGNTTTYGLGVTNNSCIYSLTYSNSATFYNINVSTSSCNRVMIDSLD
jgi:hypothetical protein